MNGKSVDVANLSSPPATEVEWEFAHLVKSEKVEGAKVIRSTCKVKDRTWFGARRQALVILGCEIEALELIK